MQSDVETKWLGLSQRLDPKTKTNAPRYTGLKTEDENENDIQLVKAKQNIISGSMVEHRKQTKPSV